MQAQEARRSAMLDLARRWRESGAKARVFAQEHGITAWTLYYWRKRLVREKRPARRRRSTPRVRLAPVQLVASDGHGHDLEVMLAGGDRIRVPAGISAETLRCVIQVLRTALLTLSPAVRIYLATGATDLRRSIDGLSALVRERLALDPLSGHLFLFRNRRGDRVKILLWDQSGFWVLYKRLEQWKWIPARRRSAAIRGAGSRADGRCPRTCRGGASRSTSRRRRSTARVATRGRASARTSPRNSNTNRPTSPPPRVRRAIQRHCVKPPDFWFKAGTRWSSWGTWAAIRRRWLRWSGCTIFSDPVSCLLVSNMYKVPTLHIVSNNNKYAAVENGLARYGGPNSYAAKAGYNRSALKPSPNFAAG